MAVGLPTSNPSGCVLAILLAILLAVLLSVLPSSAGTEILYVSEGNNLRRFDLAHPSPDRSGAIFIEHAAGSDGRAAAGGPPRRDINGMICFLPDGSGGFVAGEDTGQPDTPPGWGVFSAEGAQRGKLTASYRVPLGDPHGCAFDRQGRLFTSEVGNVGFGASRGQLILWFPPFDRFPGPDAAYPDTEAVSDNFCKLAVDIGTAGGVAIDDEGRLYVASASRGAIYRFSPPFPTAPTPESGCAARDDTGAPLASAVQREVFHRGLYTFSGLAMSGRGTLYGASVFTGEIVEFDLEGRLLREILEPDGFLPPFPSGNPMGLAVDAAGSLYYADLDLVWSFPNIGPGPNGKVRRIRFDADGEPMPPEILLEGLKFPDGLGIATPEI